MIAGVRCSPWSSRVFIGEGKWSDEKVLAKVREMVVPQMQRHGAIDAWIIDDTGFP